MVEERIQIHLKKKKKNSNSVSLPCRAIGSFYIKLIVQFEVAASSNVQARSYKTQFDKKLYLVKWIERNFLT